MSHPVIVLYHRSCRDGFAAAAVAARYYKDQSPEVQVLYFGIDPSKIVAELQPVLSYDSNCQLRSFDVGFTAEAYQLIKNHFKDFIIVDHHKTTVESFPPGDLPEEIIFNNNYCGCVLAWKFYYGALCGVPTKENIPEFLLYLQDRDLWQTKMPDSEVINQGLFYLIAYDYEEGDFSRPKFQQWWDYMDDPSIWREKAKEIGKILIRNKTRDLSYLKKSARPSTFRGHKIMVCNATTLISDLGNLICRENPEVDFTLLYRIVGTEVWFSIRSDQDGNNFDVSEIAKQLGGGGHRNAAGFMCDFDQFQLTSTEVIIKPIKLEELIIQPSTSS